MPVPIIVEVTRYIVFGFCGEIASNLAFTIVFGDNPFGTLYKYFPYNSENLDYLFSIKLSIFGFDIVLILVFISPGLIVITLMFISHSSILNVSVIASIDAYSVAE